jgi:hypothetical protein
MLVGSLGFLLLLGGVGYWISLRLHPLIDCRTCKGTGRHYGAAFTYASRLCATCGGTARVPRLGARLFLRSEKK